MKMKIYQKLDNFTFSKVSLIIFFGLTFSVYFYVGYTSFGYDDEFFNINLVGENGFLETINFINSSDIHPPLSYISNWIFFRVFKNWQFVRAIISISLLISIFNLYNYLKLKKELLNPSLFLVLTVSNPALLLWGTSLRWHSLYLIILSWILVIPPKHTFWFLAKLPLGLLILAYTNYITFLLLIPLCIYYYYGSLEIIFRQKLKLFFIYLLAFILYYKQLIIFISIHYKNSSNQIFSLKDNVIGFTVSSLSNQGLFPLSIFGILSIISTLLLFFYVLKNLNKEFKQLNKKFSLTYIFLLCFFLISGLMGKYRNLVVSDFFKSTSLTQIRIKNNLISAAFLLIITSNIYGVFNVISHKNTIKNDWNIPTKEVLEKIKEINQFCEAIEIVNYSPLINYHLEKMGYNTKYLAKRNIKKYSLNDSKCMLFVKTYRGSMDKEKYKNIIRNFQNNNLKLIEEYKFNEDFFYKIKQNKDPDFPKYSVVLKLYKDQE